MFLRKQSKDARLISCGQITFELVWKMIKLLFKHGQLWVKSNNWTWNIIIITITFQLRWILCNVYKAIAAFTRKVAVNWSAVRCHINLSEWQICIFRVLPIVVSTLCLAMNKKDKTSLNFVCPVMKKAIKHEKWINKTMLQSICSEGDPSVEISAFQSNL